jgi:hypothetical protein
MYNSLKLSIHSTFWQLLKVEFQHIGVKYIDTDLIRNSRFMMELNREKKINLKKLNNPKRKKIS